jgi:hypothetical protein
VPHQQAQVARYSQLGGNYSAPRHYALPPIISQPLEGRGISAVVRNPVTGELQQTLVIEANSLVSVLLESPQACPMPPVGFPRPRGSVKNCVTPQESGGTQDCNPRGPMPTSPIGEDGTNSPPLLAARNYYLHRLNQDGWILRGGGVTGTKHYRSSLQSIILNTDIHSLVNFLFSA